MKDWISVRNLYYVGLLALVAASLSMVPGAAQLNTLLAKGAGTGMTVGTWLALSVGAGSILAWMRRL